MPVICTSNYFYGLCHKGSLDLIKEYMSKDHNPECNYIYGFYGACAGNKIEVIKLMISLDFYYLNRGLSEACSKDHIDVVRLMVSLGATDFNEGLIGTCKRGNLDMVRTMISLGATNFYEGFIMANYGIRDYSRYEEKYARYADIMELTAKKMSIYELYDTFLEKKDKLFRVDLSKKILSDEISHRNKIISEIFSEVYPPELINYMLSRP